MPILRGSAPARPERTSGDAHRGWFFWVAAIVWLYFWGQLLVGTDLVVVTLLTLAIAAGLLSISAAGGLRSAFGLLNGILLAKFLLIGLLLKVVLRQPSETNLHAPVTTSMAMALGFLGLWMGMVLRRRFPLLHPSKPTSGFHPNKPKSGLPGIPPRAPLLAGDASAATYLAFSLVLIVFCLGGYYLKAQADFAGWGQQSGGILGVARTLAWFRGLAIVPVMFYVWRSGSRRLLSHPLVLAVLLIELALGFFSTGKLEMMEPLMYFGLVAVLRFGARDKKVWALGAVAILFFALLVYPYSQYIRDYGGREGGASSRLASIGGTVRRMLTDENFRNVISTHIEPDADQYWGVPALAPFARFAMIAEGDRLIAATERTQSYTGWETITWELKMLVPRVLYPQKPILGPGAYLAHIAGDSPWWDDTTQWAYGPFAMLYNAFGLMGVFFGSILTFAAYYAWLAVFFGNPQFASAPVPAVMWFVCIVGLNQHHLAESGVTATLWLSPLLVAGMYLLAKAVARLLPWGCMKKQALRFEGEKELAK